MKVYYLSDNRDFGLHYSQGHLFWNKIDEHMSPARRYEIITNWTHFFDIREAVAFVERLRNEKNYPLDLTIKAFEVRLVGAL